MLKIALFGEEEHGITMVAYKMYGMLRASRIIEQEKEKEQEQRSEVMRKKRHDPMPLY